MPDLAEPQSPPAPVRPEYSHHRLRFAAWVVLVLTLLPGQLIWLCLLRGPHLLAREPVLIWGQAILGGATLALLALLKTTPPGAWRLTPRASAITVIGGTLLLQLSALILLTPVLSDDLFRYRLDGRMWLSGASPYTRSPDQFATEFPTDNLDALVPHREWPTIYPPVSQAVFTIARAMDDALSAGSPKSATTPSNGDPAPHWREQIVQPSLNRRTIVFRTVFALFAVAAVAVLVATLRLAGESVWWAAILGFSPLLTLEIGGMGHQDSIGAFLLLLTAWAAASGRFLLAGAVLALACGVKPFAGLLVPFLWRQAHEEQSFHTGRRTLAAFVLMLVLTTVPVLAFQNGWTHWTHTLARFGQTWEANGFFYESFKAIFGQGDQGRQMERAKDAARLISFLAVLATGLFLWQSRARLAEAGYWLFIVLLLGAPLAYPWYLPWALCLVPLLRGPQGAGAVVWSATAAMGYTVWRDAAWRWSVPPEWLTAQYLPVLVVLGVEVVRLARVVPLGRVVSDAAETHLGAATTSPGATSPTAARPASSGTGLP